MHDREEMVEFSRALERRAKEIEAPFEWRVSPPIYGYDRKKKERFLMVTLSWWDGIHGQHLTFYEPYEDLDWPFELLYKHWELSKPFFEEEEKC